jgi:hypothetical protein
MPTAKSRHKLMSPRPKSVAKPAAPAKAAAPAPAPSSPAPAPSVESTVTEVAAAVFGPAIATSMLNAKQFKARVTKTAKSALTMRQTLWPDVTDAQLWLRTDRTRKGFTTIPRGMPLFMEIIADASKRVGTGKSVPAGRSYLVLWCRVFDEGLVKIDDETTAAFEAGYRGERNITTWREHLKVLKDLGFIDFNAGPAGPSQFVLLLNPYHAVKRLQQKGWVQQLNFTALLDRALDIGAIDLNEPI